MKRWCRYCWSVEIEPPAVECQDCQKITSRPDPKRDGPPPKLPIEVIERAMRWLTLAIGAIAVWIRTRGDKS